MSAVDPFSAAGSCTTVDFSYHSSPLPSFDSFPSSSPTPPVSSDLLAVADIVLSPTPLPRPTTPTPLDDPAEDRSIAEDYLRRHASTPSSTPPPPPFTPLDDPAEDRSIAEDYLRRHASSPSPTASPRKRRRDPGEDDQAAQDAAVALLEQEGHGLPLDEVQCSCKYGKQNKQGRHARICALHGQTTQPQLPSAARRLALPVAEAVPALPVASGPLPFTFDEVLGFGAPLASIPPAARVQVGALFVNLLRNVAQNPNLESNWILLLAAPRLTFGARGLARLRGPERAAAVKRRAITASCGQWLRLVEEIRLLEAQLPTRSAASSATFVEPDVGRFEVPECPSAHPDVPKDLLLKASHRSKRGEFSRALNCLRNCKLAPPDDDTFDKLLRLHPQPELTPLAGTVPTPIIRFTDPEVTRALGNFAKGSAPGPTGLSIDHLRELCRLPGIELIPHLTQVCSLIASGRFPASIRPLLFGARLTALQKKDNGIRPVAVGETLRRLTAKILVHQTAPSLGEDLLSRSSQVGVSVPFGAEAMFMVAHTKARQLVDDVRMTSSMVTLDFSNAFNSVTRPAVWKAVLAHAPALASYTHAAYSAPSPLYFASRTIPSATGVHQGDPLGPLLFSLALSDLVASFTPDPLLASEDNPFRFMFYLDDGLVYGPSFEVDRFIGHLVSHGPAFGLHLNLSKCAVVCGANLQHHPIPSRQLVPNVLLGGLLPSLAETDLVDPFWKTLCDRVVSKIELCSSLHSLDPQSAYLLLRYCGGFPSTQFHTRIMGPSPHLRSVDEATLAALKSIMGNLDTFGTLACQLPIKKGGLGIFMTEFHAPLAHFESRRQAAAVAAILAPELLQAFPKPDVQSLPESIRPMAANLIPFPSCPLPAEDAHSLPDPPADTPILPAPTPASAPPAAPPVLRRASLRPSFHDVILTQAMEVASDIQKICLKSGSSSHNGYWLSCPTGVSLSTRYLQEEFPTLCRLRLGQPFGPASASYTCPKCEDTFHDDPHHLHVFGCMKGGGKTAVHTTLCQTLASLASVALLRPRREVMLTMQSSHPSTPIPQDAPTNINNNNNNNNNNTQVAPTSNTKYRMDIVFDQVSARGQVVELMLDVAVASPFTSSYCSLASKSPGGAATAYESVKFNKYLGFMLPHQSLHPIVVDSLGAWGKSAAPMLKLIADHYASRLSHAREAKVHFYSTLNTALLRAIAQQILAARAFVRQG